MANLPHPGFRRLSAGAGIATNASGARQDLISGLPEGPDRGPGHSEGVPAPESGLGGAFWRAAGQLSGRARRLRAGFYLRIYHSQRPADGMDAPVPNTHKSTMAWLTYHRIAGIPWIDSLLNASMILGGMGPVDRLTTTGAKAFASAYAIFSGLMFISVMG
ncbi:MAG: hypothetical protein WCS01_06560, partial [bacterium]